LECGTSSLSLPYKHAVEGEWLKLCKDAPSYANLNELENFMETCDKHEIVHLSESRGMNARYDQMRANVTDHRILTIENPDVKVQIIPSLGGRISSIIHKKSGKDVLQPANPETYGYPADGGYQESPVAIEIFDYELKESASGKTIVLDAILRNRSVENAFRYIREISIPASGAKVEIASTIEALPEEEVLAGEARPAWGVPSASARAPHLRSDRAGRRSLPGWTHRANLHSWNFPSRTKREGAVRNSG